MPTSWYGTSPWSAWREDERSGARIDSVDVLGNRRPPRHGALGNRPAAVHLVGGSEAHGAEHVEGCHGDA